jgi:hypothetical protein
LLIYLVHGFCCCPVCTEHAETSGRAAIQPGRDAAAARRAGAEAGGFVVRHRRRAPRPAAGRRLVSRQQRHVVARQHQQRRWWWFPQAGWWWQGGWWRQGRQGTRRAGACRGGERRQVRGRESPTSRERVPPVRATHLERERAPSERDHDPFGRFARRRRRRTRAARTR